MSKIYAKAGEVVTCENGHDIGVLNRDIYTGEVIQKSAFDFTDSFVDSPDYTLVLPCKCGAEYIKGYHSARVHFKDGGYR